MILDKLLVNSPGLSAISYRVGGISALGIAAAYVAIAVLYVVGGAWPADGEGWLAYLAAHSLLWWTALAFSVTTDLLVTPVVWAIYLALRGINKTATIAGCIFLLVLVAVDLTIVWPGCYSLLSLSSRYMSSVSDAERQLFVAAASGTYQTLSSPWILESEVLFPSMGTLIIGLVTMKVAFRKVVGHLGVLTGAVGAITAVGLPFSEEFGIGVFVTFVLVTFWFFLVGLELLALERSRRLPTSEVYLTQSPEDSKNTL